MTALEKVMQLKKEGVNNQEIISRLRNQGISPMEINDALNQSKIKEAIGSSQHNQDMVPSMMESPEIYVPEPQEDVYSPQTQSEYSASPQLQYQPSYGAQESGYVPQIEPEQQYYEEGYDPNQQGGYASSSDTIIEIAEQVFSEKIKKIEKQIREFSEFKTIYGTRIDDVNERLKRMEKYFDKMQISILEKVGEYGKGLDSIKKEMHMIEDSFSKVMKEK
jgi:DNA-binding transcriptional MerR regulator